MSGPTPAWERWAPPLNPPDDGGLPRDEAERLASLYWPGDPHLMAALMWEAYAAGLAPSPSVSTVNTGAQTVSYDPPAALGDYGAALARANWHRSFLTGQLHSVPLVVDRPPPGKLPWPYVWVDP